MLPITKSRKIPVTTGLFQPLALSIGLRYVRSRSQGFFVSFISWVSMLGICVGVAALITVLSVMNGLEAEVRTRLLNMTAHASLSAPPAQLADWPGVEARIATTPGLVGSAPFAETQAMIGRGSGLAGAVLRGVRPDREGRVSEIGRFFSQGSLTDLVPGERRIALGVGLAWSLGIQVGDELVVLIPEVAGEGLDIRPRIQTFTVSGLFEAGVQEVDNLLALVHLDDAAQLLGTSGAPTGLRLKFADIFAAPAGAARIARDLNAEGSTFTVSDWSRENATYFRAVRIEKTMMTLILMLIVAVAAFNIVAALVMVVNEKRTDIAILRTLGLPPRAVVAIFMTQGTLIGWAGAMLGVILGLVLALNVETIVPVLEQTFGFRFMDPTVFYITELPSEVHAGQVMAIAVTALALSVLSTIYPALRGSRTQPAEVLRYE